MKKDKNAEAEGGKSGTPFHVDDICNLDQIYNSNYEYFVPKKTLKEWISGKAFNHFCEYSKEEQQNLQEDIRYVYAKTISEYSREKECTKPLAIITAGASGAGKTTVLKRHIEKNKDEENVQIYVCPDETCLKNQIKTYLKDLKNTDQSLECRKNIFNKWRPASHAIKHLILANLIRDKKSFFLGASCTETFTEKFFKFLKKQGYEIRILYVTASEDTLWNSIQERNKTFIHGYSQIKQGVKKHGILLAKQLDKIVTYADEITFYYRKNAHDCANLTAIWTKNINPSDPLDKLQVFSPNEYKEVKKIHNSAVKKLKRPNLEWETLIDRKSNITFDDVCDLERIYNETYNYYLPKKTLELWMSGKAFEYREEYSLQEQKKLQKDIRDIYAKISSEYSEDNSSKIPVATITAGAPGAGKTKLVEQELNKNKPQKKIYISSSDVCLKHQIRTYQKDLQNTNLSLESRQNIYNKWKPGANLAKHLILANLIRDKKSFYLGSTCIETIYSYFLKNILTVAPLYFFRPVL